MKRLMRFLCGLAVVWSALCGVAAAQGYPTKPVRIVVGYEPGGSVDMVARLLGQKLSETWKQPVVIENRPGAGGNIGAGAVAKSSADGYTLLLTTATLAMSNSLYRNLSFNPAADFEPISELCSTFLVLVTNAGVPAHSLTELSDLAKAQPGKLNYGHAGLGSANQLIMERLKKSLGIAVTPIPYKGMAPMGTALVSGQVQMALVSLDGTLLGHLKSGKLRALAMTGEARSPLLPDIPTMSELGLADVPVPNWYGLFAPAGTPRQLVESIQKDVAAAIKSDYIRDRIHTLNGGEVVGSGASEFGARYKADLAKFARIVAEQNISPL